MHAMGLSISDRLLFDVISKVGVVDARSSLISTSHVVRLRGCVQSVHVWTHECPSAMGGVPSPLSCMVEGLTK